MEFRELIERLRPKLEGIAHKCWRSSRFLGEEDLLQEMCINLWEKCQNGEFEDKTDSYILQNCWFGIKNLLRINSDRGKIVSYDAPAKEGENTLVEEIPEPGMLLEDNARWRSVVNQIHNDGLTPREKEVFALRMDGYTMRETGERLGISFVRVCMLQKNINRKWGERIES